jgi:hypothetical protein
MTEDEDQPAETVEDLVQGFLAANTEAFLADPAQAIEKLDRFLAKLPQIPEAERQRLRRVLLGGIH